MRNEITTPRQLFKRLTQSPNQNSENNFESLYDCLDRIPEREELFWGLKEQAGKYISFYQNPYLFDRKYPIVSVENAKELLLAYYVFHSTDSDSLLADIYFYLDYCSQLFDPVLAAISDDEIRTVLNYAEEHRLLSFINRRKSLFVLQFNQSHQDCNSDCHDVRNAIMITNFHLVQPEQDRVFVFAHELGHALHLALTNDLNIPPLSSYEICQQHFRKEITPELITQKFADMTAMYILKDTPLFKHCPCDDAKQVFPIFEENIRSIIEEYIPFALEHQR